MNPALPKRAGLKAEKEGLGILERKGGVKKIVAIGRGGVGKTSFIALLAKYLKSAKNRSILLIDADPDQSLADLVGVNLEGAQIKTISDLLFDVRYGNISDRLNSFSLAEKMEYLLNQKALYEGEGFDLLTIGTKWTEGCYCQPNNILKVLISGLEKNYDYVLIDSPAGLEHLNRRITSSVDDIFAILDPAQKAFRHLDRAYRVISEIKIKFTNFYVLGNFRFSSKMADLTGKRNELKYLGELGYDQNVEKFNLHGKSLLQLPENSPIFSSIKNIAVKAGYSNQE